MICQVTATERSGKALTWASGRSELLLEPPEEQYGCSWCGVEHKGWWWQWRMHLEPWKGYWVSNEFFTRTRSLPLRSSFLSAWNLAWEIVECGGGGHHAIRVCHHLTQAREGGYFCYLLQLLYFLYPNTSLSTIQLLKWKTSEPLTLPASWFYTNLLLPASCQDPCGSGSPSGTCNGGGHMIVLTPKETAKVHDLCIDNKTHKRLHLKNIARVL